MRCQPRSGNHLRWAVLLLGVLLAGAGCGGSSHSSRAAGAPAATASTATAGSLGPAVVGHRSPGRPRARPRPRRRAAAAGQPHRAPRAVAAALRPPIVWKPIPFGPLRKAQMVAYAGRHYGSFLQPTWRLTGPQVIVIHYTDASFSSTYSTFASDAPDSELHELPGTCAHFVIDQAGTIYQLVALDTMCRHTVGLNWTAIGVEQVGFSDAQVLNDAPQITASLRLVRWLQCRFHIRTENVIGHNESLSSPYHHEDVASLRTQTHADFDRADMQIYRGRLSALGGC